MTLPRAVVALAGARDQYQLPLALHEAGLLDTLVTDLYFPADRLWFSGSVGRLLPADLVHKRYCEALRGAAIRVSLKALMALGVMRANSSTTLNWQKGSSISRKAGEIALEHGSALFCYTTYAADCFKAREPRPRWRFLFLLQADPRVRRRILEEEAELTPIASKSLLSEHEFALTPAQFEELAGEPSRANGWVASSTFAASTLAASGIATESVHVVPYGVDLNVFTPRKRRMDFRRPLRVIYAGRAVQSKGLSYLFDAVRMIGPKNARLTLCVRGEIDRGLIALYDDLDIEIREGYSGAGLCRLFQESDVFVFPSLADGFGHVILEAMASGLPVIATPNTAAPDLMQDGAHGFIVPIRAAREIAAKLEWALEHRTALEEMGDAAAEQASRFTWQRFRRGVVSSYEKMVQGKEVLSAEY
ncbi:MAG TPA: glycosyltransferase family 4 protein [Blastocatellia bacterium]|nr:glycosyltransferase family 4 protein [Blastocatellia bacterium]